jgi:hypothetical protein
MNVVDPYVQYYFTKQSVWRLYYCVVLKNIVTGVS